MAYSIGLTLYNLGARRDGAVQINHAPRPAGRIIWVHAPTADAARSVIALSRRLVDDDGVKVLITCPAPVTERHGFLVAAPPPDTPVDVRAFLDHWAPEMVVFCDGELRPALLNAAEDRKLPVLMVDGRAPYILKDRDGWFPGLTRGLLATFRHVLTVDEAAARAFRKAGAATSAVQVTGRMEEDSAALTCNEAERAALAKLVATRPVWLAAGVPEAEEAVLIAAHQAALSMAHRLLLIVVPQEPARAEVLAQRMEEQEGWTVALRSADMEPDTDTEVYIADNPAEYGLWYRLAPVTFMGGSLSGGGCARNPLEPAALGSAILYGPRTGVYAAIFGRLGAESGARAVGSAADLGDGLSELLSPDRAAKLAQSAWAVASDGAETTDIVTGLVRKIMDGTG